MKKIFCILGFLFLADNAFGQSCNLKKATATQEISIGPFLDSTDGNTEKTALTPANTDVRLKKGSADWASKNSGGATAEEHGNYRITLDATDTATAGILEIYVHMAGALPAWKTCHVFEAAVFDAYYNILAIGYVANAPMNAAQLGGTSQTGRDIGASVLLSPGTGTGQIALTSGNVTVGTNSDKTGYALTSAYDLAKTASQAGDIMKLSTGTGANQISLTSGAVTIGTITDKTGYSLTSAYDPAKTAAQAGDIMKLSNGTGTGQISLSSGGVTVATNSDKTGYGLATNSVNAAALASDAVTEIQTGLYTYQKNVAGQKFAVIMYDSSTGNPKTGATGFTCAISKDFGSFTGTNQATPTEVGHGLYYLAATQAETNATSIFVYCTATGSRDFLLS